MYKIPLTILTMLLFSGCINDKDNLNVSNTSPTANENVQNDIKININFE